MGKIVSVGSAHHKFFGRNLVLLTDRKVTSKSFGGTGFQPLLVRGLRLRLILQLTLLQNQEWRKSPFERGI
jgi:hypothetical protein